MTDAMLFGELSADGCLCTPDGTDDLGNHYRIEHPNCPVHVSAPEPTITPLTWPLAHHYHDEPYPGCPYCHSTLPPKALWKAPQDWQRLERTALELRARGLSYPAMSVVFDLYEGYELTDHTLRAWLKRLGAPAVRTDLQAVPRCGEGRFVRAA